MPESGTHLPMPSLDERANIYLRAIHGDRDFTSQERLDARHHLLDAMASDVVARPQIPAHERERPGFAVGLHPGPAPIAVAQFQPRASEFAVDALVTPRDRSRNAEYSEPAAYYDDSFTPQLDPRFGHNNGHIRISVLDQPSEQGHYGGAEHS